jgi:hypothetical protein
MNTPTKKEVMARLHQGMNKQAEKASADIESIEIMNFILELNFELFFTSPLTPLPSERRISMSFVMVMIF